MKNNSMYHEGKENQSILNSFDFGAIDELDPSLSDGSRLIYEREVPFELRIHDSNSGTQEVGSLEAIRVKILRLGSDSNIHSIRIELMSENDLFFYYIHNVDENRFRAMQETQKLMIDFNDYPNILVKMLNSCIKEPSKYFLNYLMPSFLAVFMMHKNGTANLDFIQNIQYKFIELLSCEFESSSEELIRQQITFRYNSVKSKLSIMQDRLHDINSLVKVKNPSLLLQIQKNPSSMSKMK